MIIVYNDKKGFEKHGTTNKTKQPQIIQTNICVYLRLSAVNFRFIER